MRPLHAKIVAVLSAVVLLLPPGWCVSAVQLAAGSEARPAATCCQHKAPAQSKTPCPQHDAKGCCCLRDATVAEKAVTPAPLDAVSLAHLQAPIAASAAFDLEPVQALLFAQGPPLNVLHCQWRN